MPVAAPYRVHLDTDFAGDPDDACALAYLLARSDVEVVGITTNLDRDGRRTALLEWFLDLAGAPPVPVAAGAAGSSTDGAAYDCTWDDARHWPDHVAPRHHDVAAVNDLLLAGIAGGATIVAIGALTNLAALERSRPGALADADIVAMAGWMAPPRGGLPPWGPEIDFNVQCDTAAAQLVVQRAGRLTLVTLPAAIEAHLRGRDLDALRTAGPVGALLAAQSEAHAHDAGMPALGAAHPGLPDDLVNFHWDPLTAAIATGWASPGFMSRPDREESGQDATRSSAGSVEIPTVSRPDRERFGAGATPSAATATAERRTTTLFVSRPDRAEAGPGATRTNITADTGVEWRTLRLGTVLDDGVLRFVEALDGRDVDVVTAVDGPAFAAHWLATVTGA